MKFTIARHEVSSELAKILTDRLAGIRYAYMGVIMDKDRAPYFFKSSGVFISAAYESDTTLPANVNFAITTYDDPDDFLPNHAGKHTHYDMFNGDKREPTDRCVWYFANGDIIEWLYE